MPNQTFYGGAVKFDTAYPAQCNCLWGNPVRGKDGSCSCTNPVQTGNDVIEDVIEPLPPVYMNLNGLPTPHLTGRQRRINPCLGKQASTGFRYVPTSDGLCVLVNEATGQVVNTVSNANAGSGAVVATGTDIGAAVSSQISALLNNKTLLYVGLAGLAYYFIKKK